MKTLILSCNTGEGHNSCAKAIKEYYDALGQECVIEDALQFVSKSVSRLISGGHVWIYRHVPSLFRFGYRYAEKHPAVFHENSGVYRILTLGTKRIYRFIVDGGYDAVICTHVSSALMLTDVLKKYPLKIATGFVATDYTCSPCTKESDLDYYFIPDASLASEFESPNIPAEKMVDSGIPIRQMFYAQHDMAEAKQSVGVQPSHKHLLITCGSMGCGPIRKLAQSLFRGVEEDQEITIICGTNRKLRKKLDKQYGSAANIHIRGYVSDMSSMLDSADLYLTKPGGISVSEAALKNVPMVFIDVVAGCEEYNSMYFIHAGGAKTGSTIEELTQVCLTLLDDGSYLKMKDHLVQIKKRNAAKVIYDTLRMKTEALYEQSGNGQS